MFRISFLRLSAALVPVLIACSLSAQPYVDVLNVKAQYFPRRFATGESGDLTEMQYEAAFLLPLEQKSKDVILIGGDYYTHQFHLAGQTTSLQSAMLELGYEKRWKNSRWRTMVMALPRRNSDFKSGTTSDFQMGGVTLSTLEKSDSLKFHFGLYYNREFFGDYFIPLVGIDWTINRKLALFGDLPANMNLEYRAGKKVYIGLAYQSIVASYRVGGGKYVREGDTFWGHDQVKGYVHYYLNRHLVWFAEAGQTIWRKFQLYNGDEANTSDPLFRNQMDGCFFNTGLAFRFRLDEK